MRITRQKLTPWLWGIGAATLLFALLLAFAGFRYVGSDDSPILRSFMGYEGGVPATYHMCLHTAFAWLLHGLAVLFPGIAWFSILQLFLLWFSSAVLVKSMAQCGRQNGLPLWAGGIAGCVFLGMFAAYPSCRISFTSTGALVGAAAAAQMMSVDVRAGTPGQILRGMALSIALLLCCYCLRQISVLPPLGFWLLALALAAALRLAPLTREKRKAAAKPLALGALLCALCFGLFAGVRAAEIKALNLEEFLRWQNARIPLFDYTDFGEHTTPETLEAMGWTPAQLKLVANWFFMDESITAEAFETLYAAQMEGVDLSLQARLGRALDTLRQFFLSYPAFAPACLLMALLALWCAILPLLRRAPGGIWRSLAALGAAALGLALLFYLAWRERLPLRAAVTALFPLGAFLFCLLLSSGGGAKPRPRWLPLMTLAVCLAGAGLALGCGWQYAAMINPERDEEIALRAAQNPLDLRDFALSNPDMLIICDLSLVADGILFPDTSQGIPTNIMFWGGYPSHTPSWNYQLAQFGIDGEAMTARDFLRDNVLVAGTDGQPWVSLIAFLSEKTGAQVDWDFYEEYGFIGFFQLYQY